MVHRSRRWPMVKRPLPRRSAGSRAGWIGLSRIGSSGAVPQDRATTRSQQPVGDACPSLGHGPRGRWNRMRVSCCTCALFIALTLTSSGAIAGAAEPSAACRSLASRFGTAAAQLDAKSLVDLATCVAVELGERAGTAEPLAASPGDTASESVTRTALAPFAAPAESGSSPPPRQYGAWPPSAAWMENWPPTGPWQRP